MLHNFVIDVNDGAFNEDELMQYAMEHTRLNGFDDDDEDNPEERIEDENSTRAILLRHISRIRIRIRIRLPKWPCMYLNN